MYIRKRIERSFGNFAYVIACHAWTVCFLSFLCNALFGLGLINLVTKNLIYNQEDMYLPRNTQVQENLKILLKTFPEESVNHFYPHRGLRPPVYADVVIWRKDKENLLNSSLFTALNSIVQHVKHISVNSSSGNQVTFHDVCALRNDACVILGTDVLEYINATEEKDVEIPRNRDINFFAKYLADYKVVNKTITEATYLRLRFYLMEKNESKLWLNGFIEDMQAFKASIFQKGFEIVFAHSGSFFEELSKDSKQDIQYFSLVFTIYFIFIGFVLSGGNSLTNRANIGRMGIIVTVLSIIGAWGVLAASHVMYTDIVGITPFFIACHQIINVMITLSHLSETYEIADGKDRVSYAIQKSIIPITASLISHILPFAVGVMSTFYVVKMVSIYIVTTLLFNYVNHVVFYTACLALNERRIDDGRHYCVCTKLGSRDQMKGRHCCFICCCTGGKPTKRSDTESKLQTITRQCIFRTALTIPVKFISFVSFIAVLVFAIFGLMNNFRCDVIQPKEVLPGSYFHEWNTIVEANFKRELTAQFAVAHPLGFKDDMKIISNLFKTLKAEPDLAVDQERVWQNLVSNSTGSFISEADLVKYIRSNPHSSMAHNLVIDDLRSEIIASRILVRVENISSTRSIANVQNKLNAISVELHRDLEAKYKNLGIDSIFSKGKFVIIYSTDFLLIDGYMRPLWEMITFLAVQCGVIFVISLCFNESISHTLFIPFCYVAMTTSIVGLSSYFNMYLCQVSMLFYMIGGCYCVEVIIQSFLATPNKSGEGKQRHFKNVLSNSTQSLLFAILGQSFAICILILAKSFFFVTVFRLTVTTTGVCVITLILWLPLFMSISWNGDSYTANASNSSTEFQICKSSMTAPTGTETNKDVHKASSIEIDHEAILETNAANNDTLITTHAEEELKNGKDNTHVGEIDTTLMESKTDGNEEKKEATKANAAFEAGDVETGSTSLTTKQTAIDSGKNDTLITTSAEEETKKSKDSTQVGEINENEVPKEATKTIAAFEAENAETCSTSLTTKQTASDAGKDDTLITTSAKEETKNSKDNTHVGEIDTQFMESKVDENKAPKEATKADVAFEARNVETASTSLNTKQTANDAGKNDTLISASAEEETKNSKDTTQVGGIDESEAQKEAAKAYTAFEAGDVEMGITSLTSTQSAGESGKNDTLITNSAEEETKHSRDDTVQAAESSGSVNPENEVKKEVTKAQVVLEAEHVETGITRLTTELTEGEKEKDIID